MTQCNCKNTDELRIVRGNAFGVQINIEARKLDGTLVEDFDLSQAKATLKVIHYDQKTEKSFVVAGNSAIISFDNTLPLGWYGFEMYGTFNDSPWRWCVQNVFQIVETNEKANIPTWTFLTDDTYTMDGSMTLMSGEVYQSDWDETNIYSPSYIKNKPDVVLHPEFNQTVERIDHDIDAEELARQQADQTLQGNIDAEETRAKGAEKQNADDIDAEELARQQADTTLQNNIDNEATARDNADTTLQGHIDAEETRAKAAEKQNADDIDAEELARQQADQTLQGNIDAEETRAKAAEKQNADDIDALENRMGTAEDDIDALEGRMNTAEDDIDAIESKIPSAASDQNKLVDQQQMNSSISTATATYRGAYNEVSDLSLTVAATHAQIEAALATKMAALSITPDNNDYAFVQIPTADATPTEIARVERYKYNGTAWAFEYALNNSGFTAAQWAALNSGITSGLVTKLRDLPTNAELTTLLNGLSGDISDEATARQNADTTLQGNIDEEALARGNADTTLQGHIDDEETRAKAAEKQNADDIDALENRMGTAEDDIDALEGRMNTAEDDIDTIESKIPAAASDQNKLVDKQQMDNATANFITKSVNDLVNYYLRSDTYTKAEVQQLIAAVKQFTYEVVQTLPTASASTMNKIYLVPSTNPETQNVKDEYITIATETEEGGETVTTYSWEQIGSTTVDLSGYYTSAQTDTAISNALTTALADYSTTSEMNTAITNALNTALADYSTTSQMNTAISTALASYYTKTEVDTALNGKQDILTFDNTPTENSNNPVKSGGIYSALAGKQASITDGVQIGLGGGLCTTAAATPAKEVTISNFILLKYAPVSIRFQNGISINGSTLNISSTGAKPILIGGVALHAGVVKPNTTATMYYDGTNWNVTALTTGVSSDSELLVDLGLPSGLLWATRNLDVNQANGFAASPYQYECSFFSWGNTDGHNPVSNNSFGEWSFGNANTSEPYVSSPGAALTASFGNGYDAACVNLGKPWRMPTTEEFAELFSASNTKYINADGTDIDSAQTNKLTTVNGITGLLLKSLANGKTIFFPCSGYGSGQSWGSRGSYGYYWSSSLYSQTFGRYLNFYSGGVYPQNNNSRFYGVAVRAVQ